MGSQTSFGLVRLGYFILGHELPIAFSGSGQVVKFVMYVVK